MGWLIYNYGLSINNVVSVNYHGLNNNQQCRECNRLRHFRPLAMAILWVDVWLMICWYIESYTLPEFLVFILFTQNNRENTELYFVGTVKLSNKKGCTT